MTEFDTEKFEEKYVYYFEELETAYSEAYQQLHGRYDSTILKAIDRQVLSESEPFYQGDGKFRVELPENPRERVGSVSEHEQFDTVLETLVDRIEAELRKQFEFDETE
ncbi:hypothetical protein C488_12029 [Natrinema pellirubrum DSM 15624]|uniref:Uncharacterized protein n=1 Tax=Natrinema pellirubrum (strain DSM 15624 / CIP 106293 / JCM 10476 / NCIMB 786 / 157) TaxID=797303 RepID=L0JLJ8_NATP1|nr:DUF5783 family protein [Natrinema pellirubrum]AGB32390.1 hypothetical protein Natpe_2581 [Natrinema pellirubrum DSM 15624]ELY73973.1 hypothetical protein C488_12029 [Natrinema pellirubrum DSM 15624]